MSIVFGETEYAYPLKEANVVIIPVPYEHSTSYGQGTALGPAEIIRASAYMELYDEEIDSEPWRAGVYVAPEVDTSGAPEQVMAAIESAVATYLDMGKFVIPLGGEHSISYGVYRAFHKRFDNLSVLQFDAHSDLRESYQDSIYSHASVMKRIWDLNKNIVQVGIRAQDIEERKLITENGIKTYYAHQVRRNGFSRDIIEDLSENVFITFDVDYFDPSIMPSTGTPEPGGFYWQETLDFLKLVFQHRNVVGCDVVELSPAKGISHPDFLTTRLVYKFIGYWNLWR